MTLRTPDGLSAPVFAVGAPPGSSATSAAVDVTIQLQDRTALDAWDRAVTAGGVFTIE